MRLSWSLSWWLLDLKFERQGLELQNYFLSAGLALGTTRFWNRKRERASKCGSVSLSTQQVWLFERRDKTYQASLFNHVLVEHGHDRKFSNEHACLCVFSRVNMFRNLRVCLIWLEMKFAPSFQCSRMIPRFQLLMNRQFGFRGKFLLRPHYFCVGVVVYHNFIYDFSDETKFFGRLR